MDAITLDQFAVFLAIVDEGSFAAAARRMNRAQSAITYAIQKLEEQSDLVLFDRAAYRPALTEAGRALLPRARRIAEDVADFKLQARSIAHGLEAELHIVTDIMAPMPRLVSALAELRVAFPLLRIRIAVEDFDNAARALSEDRSDLGLLAERPFTNHDLTRSLCGETELVAVAAPEHPLAKIPPPLTPERLRDQVHLVLQINLTPAQRDQPLERTDYGVRGVDRWYVTDLAAKHDLLLAGLGWGSMPRHRIAADLASGRLVALQLERWDGLDRMPRIPYVVAHRKDKVLGPAGRLLREILLRPRETPAQASP
jgi:DNA-binding transcriptional LysR family regulator